MPHGLCEKLGNAYLLDLDSPLMNHAGAPV